MFEDATVVRIIRNGSLGTTYDSWQHAVPHIELGDQLRVYMANGTTHCLEAVRREYPGLETLEWEPVMRPC